MINHSVLIEELAEHMNTSVTMIQKHYNHILLRKAAGRIAGDRNWALVERR